MPYFQPRPTYVFKARRRGGRSNGLNKDVEKLEATFSIEANNRVYSALDSLRDVTTEAKVERLYRAGKAEQIADLFGPGDTKDFFNNVGDLLGEAMRGGSKVAVQGLPIGADNQASFSLRNDRIDAYVSTRTGAFIKDIPDDMQVIVQNAVRTGMASGKSAKAIAADIYDGIGLDPTRANSVATYEGKDREAFRESMTEARAEMIARTEVSFAINHGSVETWLQAQEDGLIEEGAKKVWITDPNPCPTICEPMDGVEVGLEEDFILPDGVEVTAPPAHPRCRCQTGILEVDGTKPTSGREREDDEPERDEDDT